MNTRRIHRTGKVIRFYTEMTELTKTDGKITPVIDLLADLQHYCDANAIGFAEVLRIAANHFAVERSSS